MNTINKTFIYIFIALVLCSCSEFLKENPKSFLSPQSYYVNDVTLTSGIVGAYGLLRKSYPDDIHTTATDIEASSNASGSKRNLDSYTHDPNEGVFNTFWNVNYTLIQQANVLINCVMDVEGATLAVRKRIAAEAHFLRAHCYLMLVTTFGEVPLIIEETKEFDFNKSRNSIPEVYEQILRDLEVAITPGWLPTTKDTQSPGRITYWTAKGYMGKVLVYMGTYKESGKIPGYKQIDKSPKELYQMAIDVLGDVIDNSGITLAPIYGDLFYPETKNQSSESLFEVQFGSGTYGSGFSKSYGLRPSGSAIPKNPHQSYAMIGACNFRPTPALYLYYKTGDQRREWNVPAYTINFKDGVIDQMLPFSVEACITEESEWNKQGVAKYRWGKWNETMSYSWSECPNNLMIFRYADVLLLYAEAIMRSNNGAATQKAVVAVNQVLERARGVDEKGEKITEDQTPSFKNYTQFTLTLDELMVERAREFCFERLRWTDLARTGTLDKAKERKTPRFVPSDIEDYHYLYPIPQKELNKSTNKEGFYQNPGYYN